MPHRSKKHQKKNAYTGLHSIPCPQMSLKQVTQDMTPSMNHVKAHLESLPRFAAFASDKRPAEAFSRMAALLPPMNTAGCAQTEMVARFEATCTTISKLTAKHAPHAQQTIPRRMALSRGTVSEPLFIQQEASQAIVLRWQ